VAAGDRVDFEIPQAYVVEAAGEQIPLDIVYEDEDIAVIDKPAGMVVHPAPGHYTGTLVHALLGRGGAWSAVGGASRPGVVHRLDKGTYTREEPKLREALVNAQFDLASARNCSLVVLISVLIGAELGGILGALGAIPVAGSIQVVVNDYLAHRGERREAPAL